MAVDMIKYYLEDYAVYAGCRFEKPNVGDAGYDIYAANDQYVFNTATPVHTGLSLEIPYGHVGIIKDRGSIAIDNIVTHAGVIDSGYRGEVVILMSALGPQPSEFIMAGQKIAQLIIVPVLSTYGTKLVSLDELTQTERGDKGFGSTGV